MLVSPPCGADRTGPSFTLARVQINETRAEERLRTFDDSVTGIAQVANAVTASPAGRGLALGQRDLDLDLGSAARLRANLERPLFQLGALAHGEQSQVLVLVQAGLGAGDIESLTIVLDRHRDAGRLQVHGDLRHLRARVLVDVGEGLLDDAEEDTLGVARQPALLADHVETGGQAIAIAIFLDELSQGRDQAEVVERHRPQVEDQLAGFLEGVADAVLEYRQLG